MQVRSSPAGAGGYLDRLDQALVSFMAAHGVRLLRLAIAAWENPLTYGRPDSPEVAELVARVRDRLGVQL